MAHTSTETLHDVHTATNDVLTGYREMARRAEPDIQAIVDRLTTLHERHAQQQEALLASAHSAGADDTSIQGTVNKAVVVLRDWVSSLDRDVLPAVRDGEESLRGTYVKALQGESASRDVTAMLRAQLAEIDAAIAGLPKR